MTFLISGAMQQTRELRAQMIQRRSAVAVDQRRAAAAALATHLRAARAYARARRLAAYLAQDDEVDTGPLLDAALADGKQCFVPVIVNGSMRFRSWRRDSPMRPNRFGILEPEGGEECEATELELVLTPLVAFDAEGNRMGMGGGYYDRTFAFLAERFTPPSAWPLLVGLAFEVQRVPRLDIRTWDVPLHAVITEAGWFRFRGRWEDA